MSQIGTAWNSIWLFKMTWRPDIPMRIVLFESVLLQIFLLHFESHFFLHHLHLTIGGGGSILIPVMLECLYIVTIINSQWPLDTLVRVGELGQI